MKLSATRRQTKQLEGRANTFASTSLNFHLGTPSLDLLSLPYGTHDTAVRPRLINVGGQTQVLQHGERSALSNTIQVCRWGYCIPPNTI